MHVGVYTYQTGHRKTLDVVSRLLPKGYEITLFAFPFVYRPTKSRSEARWQERPWNLLDFEPEAFYRRLGVRYIPLPSWDDDAAALLDAPGEGGPPKIYLTCVGAKRFPAPFVTGRMVLNCHPALLPQNRGLDAFKWGVLNGWPFGVSLFVMDDVLDQGRLLYRMRTPVTPCDTLDDVAARNYQLECDLTAGFETFLPNWDQHWVLADDPRAGVLSEKLIPEEEDRRIHATFLSKRALFVDLAADAGFHPHPADAGR